LASSSFVAGFFFFAAKIGWMSSSSLMGELGRASNARMWELRLGGIFKAGPNYQLGPAMYSVAAT
jgi:hypothetical protein